MQELLDEIRPLPASSPQFQAALTKLTENFDEFPESPWPMQQGQGQGASARPCLCDCVTVCLCDCVTV